MEVVDARRIREPERQTLASPSGDRLARHRTVAPVLVFLATQWEYLNRRVVRVQRDVTYNDAKFRSTARASLRKARSSRCWRGRSSSHGAATDCRCYGCYGWYAACTERRRGPVLWRSPWQKSCD